LNESPVAQDAEPDAPAALAGQRRFRAVFISDLHLGTPGCQADALLDFLKHHPSDHLYLVGDIVDGWQLRRRWFWPQAHNDVVQKLLRRARKGAAWCLFLATTTSLPGRLWGIPLGALR